MMESKSIDLEPLGAEAYQNIDFTSGFTETDPNNDISVANATHVDTQVISNADAYLYKDYGAGYFGEFDFKLNFNSVSTSGKQSACAVWGLSNTVDDFYNQQYVNKNPSVFLFVWRDTSTLYLYFSSHNGVAQSAINQVISASTEYYCRMERSDTKLYCRLYSDKTFSTLVKNFTVTFQSTTFRYLYAVDSWNLGQAQDGDWDIDNMQLWVSSAPPWTNVPPVAKGEHPTNNSVNQRLKVACGGTITDSNSNHTMNVTFAENSSGGVWVNRHTNTSVANNSKVNWTFNQFNTGNTKYWWRMYVSDGIKNVTFTYAFTTQANWSNSPPTATGEHPTNGSANIKLQTAVGCTVNDANTNHTLNVTFAENSSGGVWVNRQTNNSVARGGKVNWTFNQANAGGTKYYWRVYVHDGYTNKSFTYYFDTITNVTLRENTNVFDYWFSCGNTTGREAKEVFDYWFLCGNITVRAASDVFDYYFLCGNDTVRTQTNIFNYYFNCGNNTIRDANEIFNKWFLCGNTTYRESDQVFDYWFSCGNDTTRSSDKVMDYWFMCGNMTFRDSNKIVDYWFSCGNITFRDSKDVFDYYFLCGNATSRAFTNVIDYWFTCGNETNRNQVNVFNYYFICGNITTRNNINVFDYWFTCRNDSGVPIIILSNPVPNGTISMSINSSNVSGHSTDILFSIQRNNTRGYDMNTSVWFNGSLLLTNNEVGNGTFSFWLFDYYNGSIAPGVVYNWTVNCSSGIVYINETYSFMVELEDTGFIVIPIANFPMTILLAGLIIVGIIIFYFVFIRKRDEITYDDEHNKSL